MALSPANNKGVACCWAATGPRITPRLTAGFKHKAFTMWERAFWAREDVRLLGQTVKILSSSLRFADLCLESGLCSRLFGRKDVRGISRWLRRTIGFNYLMVSLAFFASSSPRIPTPVGVWQGAREDSWTLTEFSLALLEPSLTPPVPPSSSKKKRSHVRSLSQPPWPLNIAR